MELYKKILTVILLALFMGAASSCKFIKSRKPGVLGIEVQTGSGKVSSKTPYIITGIVPQSPADRAGMLPEDVIVQINKVTLKNQEYDYIYKNLLLGDAGTKIMIVINRKGKTIVFELVRDERVE